MSNFSRRTLVSSALALPALTVPALAVNTQPADDTFARIEEHRAMQELEAGIVYINLPTSGAEIQLPFGGVKQTGNGHREAGWMAMDYCTEWKAVYVNYAESAELVRAQIDTQPSG